MAGFDLLGIVKISDQAIDAIPVGSDIGLLEITFGDTSKKLARALKRNPKNIRAHLTDGTGQRNHNAEPGAPGEKDWDAYIKGAKKYEAIKKANPQINIYLSPRLEYDCKDQATVNKWFNIIRANAPSCIPVASAFTGWVPSGVKIEKHGNNASGDITSNDGESLSDAQQTFKQSARLFALGWLHTCNGRGSGDDGFVPPSKRPSKAFADIHDINYIKDWFTLTGDSKVKEPEIIKPYAEYYSLKDDWRERKLCYLSKILTKQTASKPEDHAPWDICTRAGKKVSVLKWYPGKVSGLNRYYCPDYCDDLVKKLGGTAATLKSGSNKIDINVIYRQGKKR